MHPMLNTAVKAARAAGRVTTRAWDRIDTLNVREKSRNDFVTEVDLQAEQTIVQILRQAYPDHGILAEEGGHQAGDDYVWVIDPLDGTTNFLHKVPHFAISIALKHRGRLEQGLIYDPLREELFTATRGAGAFLNDRRIRVGDRTELHGALLGTGIPFREEQNLEKYLKTLAAMIVDTAGVRRPGSAALDLAYVAAGRFRRVLGDGAAGLGSGGRAAAGAGGRGAGQRLGRQARCVPARGCGGGEPEGAEGDAAAVAGALGQAADAA
jgi:myo-inositol-1(or 4)-monophosphatase